MVEIAATSERFDRPSAPSSRNPRAHDPLGRALAILRLSRRLNQHGLARAAGMHGSAISDYERGKNTPAMATVTRILEALDFTMQDLDAALAFIRARDRREFPPDNAQRDPEAHQLAAAFAQAVYELYYGLLRCRLPAPAIGAPAVPLAHAHPAGSQPAPAARSADRPATASAGSSTAPEIPWSQIPRRRPSRAADLPDASRVGTALLHLRERRGLRQCRVAERAGISKSMLSNYERGKQCPSLPTLVKILNQLHCSVEDFGRILVAAAP
jgi:transcriptional regulator with XRE-family HTH domain